MTTAPVRAYYFLDEAFELVGGRLYGNLDKAGSDRRTRREIVERTLLDALATGRVAAILPGADGPAAVPAVYWSKRLVRKPTEPRGYSIELSQLMPVERGEYSGPSTVGIMKDAFDRWLRTLAPGEEKPGASWV